MRITTTTTRRLRAVASKVFPNDAGYRAWLGTRFGVASTLDLTEAQGQAGADELARRLRGPEPAPVALPLAPQSGATEGRGERPPQPEPEPHPSGRPHWSRRYRGAGRKGYAARLTSKQAAEIARLEDELGWTADPRRLAGMIQRTLRLDVPKLVSALNKAEATDCITALRRMAAARSAISNSLDDLPA